MIVIQSQTRFDARKMPARSEAPGAVKWENPTRPPSWTCHHASPFFASPSQIGYASARTQKLGLAMLEFRHPTPTQVQNQGSKAILIKYNLGVLLTMSVTEVKHFLTLREEVRSAWGQDLGRISPTVFVDGL